MNDTAAVAPEGESSGFLDKIETIGNKVPHPVIMFLYLIAGVAVLSMVLSIFDVSVTEEVVTPVPKAELHDLQGQLGGSIVAWDLLTGQEAELPDYTVQEVTYPVRNLLSIDGIRYILSTFVNNFAGFAVVAVTFVAMAGVGVAEQAGMMDALIRRLVSVAPSGAIAFSLIFIGVLSSVASDAGYLILIPLSAAAFHSLGRHPLAGLAAAYAGVGCIFGVNLLITPVDSMLTEITNEAIGSSGEHLDVTANLYFGIVSSFLLAAVAVLVTQRIVERRLGAYDAAEGDPAYVGGGAASGDEVDEEAERRGLKFAFRAMVAMLLAIVVLVAPPGAPLRHPVTDAIIGNTPFMASLIFLITLVFLACGIAYGIGAKTITASDDVIAAVTKTFAGLSGLIFMLLMISQFIAYFNYTNIPRVLAVVLAGVLESANVGALPLLIAMILVILLLDFILPGVVPKWAIFAPVFIPIFMRLGVAPQTVLAAYRVGDGPVNVMTPLMVYLPFIVTVAQRYQRKAGMGTIVALMLPYVVIISVAWILLFGVFWVFGIPLGPGAPISL
ncbi:MAG: AbgT family transporter [Microthrixaceae bacterium]|nr:AbgT family transporter [Microthrixaceae bacterium]MCO5313303.1 AbgT family transporter [Microthrixaceae bacterium]HPB45175.1 AbgT family transporter [Microthrixaceae bacterium]